MKNVFPPEFISKLERQLKSLSSASVEEREAAAVYMLQELSAQLRGNYPTPAAAIRHFLDKWGHQEAYLGKVLNSRSRASEILNGKRPLSLSDLRTLRDNLGIPVDLLLDDPKAHGDIDFSRYPVGEMHRLGLIPEKLTKRSPKLKANIEKFFQRAGSRLRQQRVLAIGNHSEKMRSLIFLLCRCGWLLCICRLRKSVCLFILESKKKI